LDTKLEHSFNNGTEYNRNTNINNNLFSNAEYPDGCTLSQPVAIVVNPNPSLSVTPRNSLTCNGNSVTINAVANIVGTTFAWSTGGTSGSSITVTPATTTTYYVTATAPTGCQSVDSATVVIPTAALNVCNVLYASPTGTPTALGSKADPLTWMQPLYKPLVLER
jgi:hypothetical protein